MCKRVIVLAALAALSVTAQGQISRVSVDSSGGDANGASTNRAISGDGRYVAFSSAATDLVAGDGNGVVDIFVRDRQSGLTTRVSVDSAGNEANGASSFPAISEDGSFVAFASLATNLVAGDLNVKQDVFLHDLGTGTTIRVSVDSAGNEANDDSFAPWLDQDGDVIVFPSLASNLVVNDTNLYQDIFVRDLAAGTTTRVSVSSTGQQGNQKSIVPSLSGDGMKVAFSSLAGNFVAGDTNTKADIFVHDRWTATTTRVSVSTGDFQGNGTSGDAEISRDGTKVVFDSNATNLVANDTNFKQDVFLRDLVNATTIRVSVDAAGVEGNGNSFESTLDATGTTIAFISDADNLVANDTNGNADLFASYLDRGYLKRLSLGPGKIEADGDSHQPEISSDGFVVAFHSDATNLNGSDGNGLTDIYAHASCEVNFTEFGVGLGGLGGFVPHLTGDDGNGVGRFAMHLTEGLGFASGILWVGLGQGSLQVVGGTFYVSFAAPYLPLPFVMNGPVGVAGAGFIDFPGADVSAISGLTVYIQTTILDDGAPHRISMSNALQMDLIAR